MTVGVNFDVMVVGSGASAVHAAWPLAEAGLRVAMFDVGNRDELYAPLIPQKGFTEIRTTESAQDRYFLGDQFEGISIGKVGLGAQLTPPRLFITRDAERLAPLQSETLNIMQSFAVGGLAAGWGAGTLPFSEQELASWPLAARDLRPHFETVAQRIGISGSADDLAPFIGNLENLLPPVEMDSNAEQIFSRYQQRRTWMQRAGLFAGRGFLAVASRPFRGRGPLRYHDMEFWSDGDRSVYRPAYTLEELRAFSSFSWHPGWLAEQFSNDVEQNRVTVSCMDLKTGYREQFSSRRLILAAGTFGTARIVLRSLNRFDESVPFVTNPYCYYPMLNLRRLGKPTRDRRHSLVQLAMLFDPDATREHVLQLSLFSYRSLLLYKLVKESPLAHPESIRLMQLLHPYFVILGVHQEDRPSPLKFLKLSRGAGAAADPLQAEYRLAPEIEERQRAIEKRILRCMRRLGCLPLKAVRPGHGSSIHYAGTFPMAEEGPPLTTRPSGELRAAAHVYLADGSTFPYLPAKGMTFTLMANANRVGELLRNQLLHESQREGSS